jgi:hypothetical protein
MNHNDKLNAIKHIRPNALFVLRGDEVEWLDETQIEPTEKEIKDGLIAYQAAQQAAAEAKAQAKAAAEGKLAALGLTTDDLRALGL